MGETNASIPWLGLVLAVVILVVAIGVIFGAVFRRQRKDDRRAALLATLGFTPLQPPPDFAARLDRLFRHMPSQRFSIPALFLKRTHQADFYVFDLLETSGESNTVLGNGAVAVISSDLRMPRLHLSRRLGADGKTASWLAGVTESVLGWAAGRMGMARVDLSAHPESDERLMVLAADPAAAQEFLTRERLGRLLWIADMQRLVELDCDADGFVIKRSMPGSRGDPDGELRALLDDARRALTAMQD